MLRKSESLLRAIESAATPQQRKYPGGVSRFLTAARYGPPLAGTFAQAVGVLIFQTHGVKKLADVFAPISSTCGVVELVGDITRQCAKNGCAAEALEAAEKIPQIVADVRVVLGRIVGGKRRQQSRSSGMAGGVITSGSPGKMP